MHRNKKKHVYIYSGKNILIMAEPMTIILEYNKYQHVYTINTNDNTNDKREALRAFINELDRELHKEELQDVSSFYLSQLRDMDNKEKLFNIIANRIKPGRLQLYDFLYVPLHTDNETYYSEKEDIDENDHRMKIFVGNFVFRVEPNSNSLVELFLNIKNLYNISANGRVPPYGFPYGYSVLEYDTMNSVRIVFGFNFLFLSPIDPESDPFKFILNKIKEGIDMEFSEFVNIVNMNMNMKTKTKTKTKLRM